MTAHLPHELVYDILATHLHELLFSTPPDPPRVSSASHGSSATYLGTVGALARASSTYHALARELLWQKVSVGMPRTWTSIMKVVEAYEEHEQASPDQPANTTEPVEQLPTISALDAKWSAMAGPPTPASASLPVSKHPFLPSPLLHTRVLSFAQFRTAGLGRSQAQANAEGRFVTSERVHRLLRATRVRVHKHERDALAATDFGGFVASETSGSHHESSSDDDDVEEEEEEDDHEWMSHLSAVGFSEFMDSAIQRDVLEELLARGGWLGEFTVRTRRPSLRPFDSTPMLSTESRTSSKEGSTERPERGRKIDFALSTAGSLESSAERRGRSVTPHERTRSATPQRIVSSRSRSRSRGRAGQATDEAREPSTSRTRPRLEGRSVSFPAAERRRLEEEHRQRSTSRGRSRKQASETDPAGPREVVRKEVRLIGGKDTWESVRPIDALDLCGCAATTFVEALEDIFGGAYGLSQLGKDSWDDNAEDEDEDEDAWHDEVPDNVLFPHMRRLGLYSSLIHPAALQTLIGAFPHLTHLDLGGTLASPRLLLDIARAGMRTPGRLLRPLRLESLSLARCRLLTGAAVVGLLVGDVEGVTSRDDLESHPYFDIDVSSSSDEEQDVPPLHVHEAQVWGRGESCSELRELSIYGDGVYPCRLARHELQSIVMFGRTMLSQLVVLDLSSAPLDDELLAALPDMPNLQTLGLSYCRDVTLDGIQDLLADRTPALESLGLVHAARTPDAPAVAPMPTPGRPAVVAIPGMGVRPGAAGPQALDERTRMFDYTMRFHQMLFALARSTKRKRRLRVVELDENMARSVQGGAGSWRIIKGNGRRQWYVDTSLPADYGAPAVASSLIPEAPTTAQVSEQYPSSPAAIRAELLRLTKLNGRVSSDVGWLARKMGIIGDSLGGGVGLNHVREDGLYAFHAFQ